MPEDLAAAYERRYPGTGCPDAQKEEREQRIRFKQERGALRRTSRNRGVVIPGGSPYIESLGGRS